MCIIQFYDLDKYQTMKSSCRHVWYSYAIQNKESSWDLPIEITHNNIIGSHPSSAYLKTRERKESEIYQTINSSQCVFTHVHEFGMAEHVVVRKRDVVESGTCVVRLKMNKSDDRLKIMDETN